MKRVNKIICLFAGFALTCISYAQDFHFSGFLQNMVYTNPAYAAICTSPEIGLTYRNQWPGIPATFVTYGATFVMPVSMMNSGIGIHFLNDVQGGGVISRTSASLLYGYLFNVSRQWQLGTGISASYVYKKLNADELVFRSDILNDLGYSYSSVVLDNYSTGFPDFGIGFIVKNNDNLALGFSVNHITRPRESLGEQVSGRLPLKYTACISGQLGKGRTGRGNEIQFEPALYYSHQKFSDELIWGTQALVSSSFLLGAWIRQNLHFNFDALILSAGISYKKYNIQYSYDVNLKKINFLSTKMAAHEVTFLYRFEYNGRKIKKVVCPAY